MADLRKYISVLAPAENNGNINIRITSLNGSAQSLFDQTFPVALTNAMDEIDTASAIVAAINAALPAANVYAGVPMFTKDFPIPLMLRLVRCDHIVNFWAQSQYRIKVSEANPAAPTNAVVVADNGPIFPTINDAEAIAGIIQANIYDENGQRLVDDQLVSKLRMCSNLVATWVEHPIAASTFLHEELGFNDDGCRIQYNPIIGWDTPYVGTPGFVGNTIPLGGFDVRQETGYLTFTSRGINPYVVRVKDMENMLKWTYVSGQDTLSSIVKDETLALTRYLNVPRHVKSVRAADFNQSIDLDKVKQSVKENIIPAIGIF